MNNSLLWLALALVYPLSAAAESKEISLAWDQLAPKVTRHKAMIELVSGKEVSGRIVSVAPDEMLVKAGGRQVSLAKADVSLIHMVHHRVRGKVIGTLCGVISGVAVGGAIAAATFLNTGPGAGTAVLGSLIGMPVAGFFLGRAADQQEVVIRVVP